MAAGPVRVKNIVSVLANAITAENILSFREEHVMNMTPQFIPNLFQGADVLQREKFRRLVITIDSENDLFDVNYKVAAINTFIATAIVVTFDLAAPLPSDVETWTYITDKSWVEKKEFGRIEDGVRRNTFEYTILLFGTKLIAWP